MVLLYTHDMILGPAKLISQQFFHHPFSFLQKHWSRIISSRFSQLLKLRRNSDQFMMCSPCWTRAFSHCFCWSQWPQVSTRPVSRQSRMRDRKCKGRWSAWRSWINVSISNTLNRNRAFESIRNGKPDAIPEPCRRFSHDCGEFKMKQKEPNSIACCMPRRLKHCCWEITLCLAVKL